MIAEYVKELITRLLRSKAKSILISFGVFWGVFMLIALLAAGKGIENGFKSNYQESMHSVTVFRGGQTSLENKGYGKGRVINLTELHAASIAEIDGFDLVEFEKVNERLSFTRYGKSTGNYRVVGVSDGYFSAKGTLELVHGRWLNTNDYRTGRKTIVLPQKIIPRLSPDDIALVGKNILIDGLSYLVVGVYRDSDKTPEHQERIYFSSATYKRVYSNENRVTRILATVDQGYNETEKSRQALRVLHDSLAVGHDDISAVYVDGTVKSAESSTAVFRAIQIFIWFIGIGTLVSGVIGVSNIMNVAIKERTTEIGLRKAIGEKSSHILLSTIAESLVVTSIAGVAGLLLGRGLISLMDYLSSIPGLGVTYFNNPGVSVLIAVSALLVLIVAGLIAGMIPAIKTVSISPVEAMKR